jgi:hypothetical protein
MEGPTMTPLPARPRLRPRSGPRPEVRPRCRALVQLLVRIPGCLVLACGLVLGLEASAAGGPAAPARRAGGPAVTTATTITAATTFATTGAATFATTAFAADGHRPPRLPEPPGADDRGTATLDGQVTPVDTEVAPAQNGDFTLTVTNTGTVTADNLRVLLDDGQEGNGVGSPDGRCLSRLDDDSPADLWCELGDLAPRQSATVAVHVYMLSCVWLDPDSSAPQLHAPAFHWRVGYSDAGRALTMNGPTPRWTCGAGRLDPV